MFQLLAVCPMGLEAVVAREIQELGYETNVENGRIFFEGDTSAIVKANYGCAQQTESKLLLDVLTQQRLTSIRTNQKRSLGNLLLIKKVTSQFKVEALNQHYIVCQIVRR